MGYRLRLDEEEAAVTFVQLPEALCAHVSAALRQLAENPSLGRKAHFPYPQEGQLFDVEPVVIDGVKHYITIMFMFSRDETTLLVKWIAHRRLEIDE